MPQTGWESVTVPGAVDSWVRLSDRFGQLPFDELFKPAINYARGGYAVTPVIQRQWSSAIERYQHLDGFRQTFMPAGRAPEIGELFMSPDHADTLESIAKTRGTSFYRGELAIAIEEDARRHDALMTRTDLGNHEGFWVDPISMSYGNLDVHEIPPNGQGLAALIALGIANHLELGRYQPDSVDAIHLMIEAMKMAFADAKTFIADPRNMRETVTSLLDPARLAARAAEIDPKRSGNPGPGPILDHGTVYLCAADVSGTMVSMIQSNFHGFGSGIVVPGTGISLQNRAAGFSLEVGHANRVDGGKRPYHTIIPGFLTRGDEPIGPFGVMGGHMQPQGHMQIICRLETWHQGLQEAFDAPRWYISESGEINLEPGFAANIAPILTERGHQIDNDYHWTTFGGGQAIIRTMAGYRAASDPRKDGHAAGF
ncbi:MAG: gamma-glutamyltranspeptidase [marine bacterium B5-7]|nr:MAG: gamma-glutamyltranspeptidase [marine bacterium B5-7]